jgi:sensor histidine kinase regulating citrate/malate metabolism
MAAPADTMSSGKVVPRLTRVAPIIRSGILVILANQIAESIKMSLPFMITTKPMKNRTKGKSSSSNLYTSFLKNVHKTKKKTFNAVFTANKSLAFINYYEILTG